jgi:hypothetical protein
MKIDELLDRASAATPADRITYRDAFAALGIDAIEPLSA